MKKYFKSVDSFIDEKEFLIDAFKSEMVPIKNSAKVGGIKI